MGKEKIRNDAELIEALRLCARGRKCRECPLGDVMSCKASLMTMAADRLEARECR